MKTHVNQHSYHLNSIAILVGITILLLSFGVYKTVTFQSNKELRTYSSSLGTVPFESILSTELNNALYSHVYYEEAYEAPLEIEEWMTDYSSWLNEAPVMHNYNAYIEKSLEIEEWMLNLTTWKSETNSANIAKVMELGNEFEPKLEIENWMLNDSGWYNTSERLITN